MPTVEEMEEQNERLDAELSLAEKKALIAQAQMKYGNDWRRFVPKRVPFSGKGTAIDWQALKFRV